MSTELDIARHLLPGALVTAGITLMAIPATLAVAFIIGLCRLSSWALVRGVAYVYVQIFRGTSLLVQVFYFYYVLPLFGITLPAVPVGVLALALNGGAYASEVVRGSILSIDRAQWEAAFALNMSRWVTLRRIVLPQAIGHMLPPFGNQAIDLLKGSALLSLITITELTQQGRLLYQTTGNLNLIYSTVLVFYFLMAQPLSLAVRRFERRRPERQFGST